MLINLSNHPIANWSNLQLGMAESSYGSVVDFPFPAINPHASETDINLLATEYYTQITTIFDECANEPCDNAVHIQGEFTFVLRLVTLLKASGIQCIASTSNRNVEFQDGGEKTVKFDFVKFRSY